MSEPEVKFEIDEYGRSGYRVTNEGVLLSKDEKEFIIDHITRMQEENAKLRELVRIAGTYCVNGLCGKDDGCPLYLGKPYCALHDRMRELGVEVTS
jgi:hypothetical protein